MKDMEAHLEKLRADAAECALIRDLATDPQKRALFMRLAEHLATLASEVEATIAQPESKAALVGGLLRSDVACLSRCVRQRVSSFASAL
jgi:hypothetical protein